jgi:hypothetical protein
MHLTHPDAPWKTEIVRLADEQVNSFMDYVTHTKEDGRAEISGFTLPFTALKDARKLAIEQAVSEKIYRDEGQLSRKWEDSIRFDKSSRLGWRADGTRGCVWMGPSKDSG